MRCIKIDRSQEKKDFFRILFLLIVAVIISGCASQRLEQSSDIKPQSILIEPGKGRFLFDKTLGNTAKPIPVWYHMPSNYSIERPILFVMHGVKRNADVYRDNWVDHAERYNMLVLAPEFSQQHFPGDEGYNFGNIVTKSGRSVPNSQWAFTAIDNIFDAVVKQTGSTRERYDIFGHSAGSQFVHRLITFNKAAKIDRAILANAGWYTLPVKDFKFPYGLDGMKQHLQGIEVIFSKRIVVLLGEDDNDPKHKYLRTTPEAVQQGPHRLARGKYYHELAKRLAQQYYQVDFNWQLVTVPNVGHSNRKMSFHAAEYLYGKHTD